MNLEGLIKTIGQVICRIIQAFRNRPKRSKKISKRDKLEMKVKVEQDLEGLDYESKGKD